MRSRSSLLSRIIGFAVLIAIFFILANILITAVNLALNIAYIVSLGVVLVALVIWYLANRSGSSSHT